MNISEFERTKPVKTMAAINSLTKEIKESLRKDDDYLPSPHWILSQLEEIKKLLRNGE
jgi:hypothetical protein